ncbi:MAG: hypothetical protein E6J28_11740 [Chloroflexi bacterium]|nr:MAG: hypothetical protein E6J28_11740 [Chloroflexota bacterium]
MIETKIGRLRTALKDLLTQHELAGTLPTSARFLFYELVAAGVISKERHGARRPDQDMNDALISLRESGDVEWEWIVDETRSLADWRGAASVREWVLDVLEQARVDPWLGDAPQVITESRSLAGVLRVLARRYAIPIAATNGQVGGFLHTVIAPALHAGQHVLYLGDLDLAGDQIEAHTRRVLERAVGELAWERLAVTQQQVHDHGLTPIVKGDRRYADGGAHEAVETEALRQEVIVEILRGRLDELLPEPLARVLGREAAQRRRLAGLLGQQGEL